MKQILIFTTLLLASTIFIRCSKEVAPPIDCWANDSTTRQLVNSPATIKLLSGKYYIVEVGTIDTKLNPCVLPDVLKVDNKSILVSGDVKQTIAVPGEPCCTENFVISMAQGL